MAYVIDNAHTRPNRAATVFIASEDILARWSSCVTMPTDLLAFADADAQHALDVIQQRRPRVVVLEQLFANTTRGEALVRHLRSDPQLSDVEIRTLPANRSMSFGAAGPNSGVALANLALPMQHAPGPIRRARRVKMPNGAELLVDGTPVALIDLSTMGAQVVSVGVLRPTQNVRVVFADTDASARAPASIAWSTVELARGTASYRAGIAFTEAHPEFLATVDLALVG